MIRNERTALTQSYLLQENKKNMLLLSQKNTRKPPIFTSQVFNNYNL
jgi:hypothetical protein